MFEINEEPPRSDIMRHNAWESQRDALQVCATALAATSRDPNTITFSHYTAAQLLGVPIPIGARFDANKAYVTFKTTRRTRAKDIIPRVWPNTDASGATIEVHGLLCTSPEALFAQMAKELSLEDLIEFGDSLVCRDPARRRTTLAELRKFIHSCDSFRGQKQCIRALTQIRENTDSPAETHLRLLLKRYGFPEPIINVPVEATGNAAHFIDLAYPKYGIGIEYNGGHHRDQITQDWIRQNSIQSTEWKIFVVDREILATPLNLAMFLACLEQALVSAGAKRFRRRRQPLSVRELCDGRRNHSK